MGNKPVTNQLTNPMANRSTVHLSQKRLTWLGVHRISLTIPKMIPDIDHQEDWIIIPEHQ